MLDTLSYLIKSDFPAIKRDALQTLQVVIQERVAVVLVMEILIKFINLVTAFYKQEEACD